MFAAFKWRINSESANKTVGKGCIANVALNELKEDPGTGSLANDRPQLTVAIGVQSLTSEGQLTFLLRLMDMK